MATSRPAVDGALLARVRADTPALDRIAHFNNAGASLPPRPVLDAVIDHLQLEARIGGYEAAAAMAGDLERVYELAARFLACQASEVAIVDSATRGWTSAFSAVPLREGDRILTFSSEYGSNYIHMARIAKACGALLQVLPTGSTTDETLGRLADAINESVRVVALTHVAMSDGTIHPAPEVGRIAHDAGALFFLDACQSAGQLPLDVGVLGCDVLALAGRKFLRAPRGTGVLYVRSEILERLRTGTVDIRAATIESDGTISVLPSARQFELFESSHALRLGLGAALSYALEIGLEPIRDRVTGLASHLREILRGIDRVTVLESGAPLSGIVTFSVRGVDAATVQARLAAQRFNVWPIRGSGPALDVHSRNLSEVLRASVHYFNTIDEIDRLADAVAATATSSPSSD